MTRKWEDSISLSFQWVRIKFQPRVIEVQKMEQILSAKEIREGFLKEVGLEGW